MSTLAAARADNFYYPPEWTPDQGSLNKFQGQHPLRERARKIDQGILVIRFEMPFNIWCGGCNAMIAKGVRFNAEKKQVGNYYSTKIWSFKMKTACCRHEIEIHTDPKNCEYVIVSGADKKTETYDEVDAGTVLLPGDDEKANIVDPFSRLEHMGEDAAKGKKAESALIRLQRSSDLKHGDNYSMNKALRAKLREQKRRVAAEEEEARSKGLGIRLLPSIEEDARVASNVQFARKFELNRRNKRAAIMSSSIFSDRVVEKKSALQPNVTGSLDRKSELLAKRRRINGPGIREALTGRFKPSSKFQVGKSHIPKLGVDLKPVS